MLDRNIDKLRAADRIYQGHLQTVASNAYEIERAVPGRRPGDRRGAGARREGADAGAATSWSPRMKPGSVLVDISVDQGGCFEVDPADHALRPDLQRSHDSVFYCVANMPGAVPHTSTYALTNVTLPYALELANRGLRDAVPATPRWPGASTWSAGR